MTLLGAAVPATACNLGLTDQVALHTLSCGGLIALPCKRNSNFCNGLHCHEGNLQVCFALILKGKTNVMSTSCLLDILAYIKSHQSSTGGVWLRTSRKVCGSGGIGNTGPCCTFEVAIHLMRDSTGVFGQAQPSLKAGWRSGCSLDCSRAFQLANARKLHADAQCGVGSTQSVRLLRELLSPQYLSALFTSLQ